MKVTSAETSKALREARKQHGSWSSVIEHAQRDPDGVLRVPKASEPEHKEPARKLG
jgi:hypothetical protein